MSPHVTDRLSAYLDGELPGLERTAVEGHIGECAQCARRLEELAAVDDFARSLPAGAPPGYFETLPSRVRMRLSGRPRVATRRPPAWAWAAAAALFLAVLTPVLVQETAVAPAPRVGPRTAPATPAPDAEPLRDVGYGAEPKPPADKEDASRAQARPFKSLETDRLSKAKAGEGRRDREAFAAPAAEPEGSLVEGVTALAPPAPTAPPREEPPLVASAPTAAARKAQAVTGTVAPQPPPMLQGADERQKSATAEEVVVSDAPGQKAEAPGRIDAKRRPAPAASTFASPPSPDEMRYHGLLARPYPTSSSEARIVREAWRAFAREHPAGLRADEARVRVVELGGLAYRLEGDPRDLALLREDARAYLGRKDAVQADRVRAILKDVRER